jgi:NAD+ kinase
VVQTVKTIGVIANCGKPRAADALRRLQRKARELDLRLIADAKTAALLGAPAPANLAELMDRLDALIAMGGDGTMLRAVRLLDGRDIPVIGVNLGSLGFLTSVTEDDLERALECYCGNRCSFTERSILEGEVLRGGQRQAAFRALNDVVLRSQTARVVTLDMTVDGEEVSHFVCDGLIVATPTGSTGHSLSGGGPVLLPATPAFIVTLICPHTLSTRPLVLPDSSAIRVAVVHSDGKANLTADGQVEHDLAVGDLVEVRRSARGVRFLHLPGYSYFAVLRQKLHWRGSTGDVS